MDIKYIKIYSIYVLEIYISSSTGCCTTSALGPRPISPSTNHGAQLLSTKPVGYYWKQHQCYLSLITALFGILRIDNCRPPRGRTVNTNINTNIQKLSFSWVENCRPPRGRTRQVGQLWTRLSHSSRYFNHQNFVMIMVPTLIPPGI